MESSTVRSVIDPTIGDSSAGSRPTTLRQLINSEWLQSGHADLVVALRRHPILLRDRSLLLNLAIEEYRAQRQAPNGIDLELHCRRFQEFGSSLQRSILRQLEAQRYIDDHPELLEALCSPTWPDAGEDFGNFRVIEELGIGATAHVYLCRQHDVGNREVVVKTSPISSFEASILGRLSHPNIIPIYSTGYVDKFNLHYLCMPYCGRSTLSDLLDVAFQDGWPRRDNSIAIAANRWAPVDEQRSAKNRRRPLSTAAGFRTYVDGVLELAIQIAEALGHAHQKGILHGDLKPSNVLLTPATRPILLDFNLSQDFANSATMCGGTLPYMPPEHLQLVAQHGVPQDKATFEQRSDIYSFGALLYELLAGVSPVTLPRGVHDPSAVAERLVAQLEQGIPSIRRNNPLVSRRLESIVLQCLAFEQGARPKTIAEVKQNLQAERRSLAAIGRFARVRPLLFSALIGLPLSALVGAAVHVVTLPPRHIVNYEQGLELASAGELDEAVGHFIAAVGSDPLFAPARIQLGRTRMALGEIDLAMQDFNHLARAERDPHSMAYVGYCFNLKRLPVAAIPWYERAIQNGAASVAIYNNLGASYLDARSHLTHSQRIRRVEDYLLKALKLDGTSVTVQLNIVRLAVTKSSVDPQYHPFEVWQHAQAILATAPNDRLVQSHVARWYGTVSNWEAAHKGRARQLKTAVSDAEKSARQAFAALLDGLAPFDQATEPAYTARSRQSVRAPVLSSQRCFLEPVLLDGTRP